MENASLYILFAAKWAWISFHVPERYCVCFLVNYLFISFELVFSCQFVRGRVCDLVTDGWSCPDQWPRCQHQHTCHLSVDLLPQVWNLGFAICCVTLGEFLNLFGLRCPHELSIGSRLATWRRTAPLKPGSRLGLVSQVQFSVGKFCLGTEARTWQAYCGVRECERRKWGPAP